MPTVLVVDDDPAIRTMVRHMLARLPCVVVEACDGEEALAHVRREPPQLILLDIVMPRLDGWAVLRILREKGLTPDIPVVLISGNVVLDAEAARELGAAAVLPNTKWRSERASGRLAFHAANGEADGTHTGFSGGHGRAGGDPDEASRG